MTDDAIRTRALAAIDAERAAWNALVGEVGEGRMDEPGPMGDWTFKDLASHLTGWRVYSIARIEAGLRGEADAPTPWPAALTTDDEINAWIHGREHDRPLADVLAEADATFPRLRAAVAALSDDELRDPNRFPSLEGRALGEAIVSGDYFGHLHEEHEPDVRAWLAGEVTR
jgi:hypothetical protein